jgi:hypothetical protein
MARIQTHVHNISPLLLFQSNNCYVNMSQCYVACTLAVLYICHVVLHKPNIRVAEATYQTSSHHHRGERCILRNPPSSLSHSVRQQLMEKDPYRIYWMGSLNWSVGDLKACHHQTHCQWIKHTDHPPNTNLWISDGQQVTLHNSCSISTYSSIHFTPSIFPNNPVTRV